MNALRRVVDWLLPLRARARLRDRARTAGLDALVGVVVVLVALAITLLAALALGTLVLDAGGPLGIVAGWVATFAMLLFVPLAAMKTATALYGRVGR